MKNYCVDCGRECTSTRCWNCYNDYRGKVKTKTKRSIFVNCVWCKKELQRGKSSANKRNFCNRKCYLAWRSANPKAQYKHANKLPRARVNCAQCDKPVTKKTKHVKEYNFCSLTCHNLWLSERAKKRKEEEERNPKHCARCGVQINQNSTHCRSCSAYLNTPVRSVGDNSEWWETYREIIKETRSRGEDHYNWHGGASFEPYGEGFDNDLRTRIRDRDNHTCQLCGKSEIENGEDLSVHHLDYSKSNHDPDNLISLCRVCHSVTNHRRERWKAFFQEKVRGALK